MTLLQFSRRRWLALFTALMTLLVPSARAASGIDRLMDVSGMRHALQQLPGIIVGSLDAAQPGVELPSQIRVAVKDAASQAFRSRDTIAAVREQLSRALDEHQTAEAIAFYETPLGRRISELERQASDPGAFQAFETYARALPQHPPSESRRGLIEAYDVATQSGEAAVFIMESTALAIALGLNAAQPRQGQVSSQELQQRIKSALPRIEAEARMQVTASLLFTYRQLADAELSDYVRFLQGTAGASFAQASARAFRTIMTDAMARLMWAMPKALERAKGAARI